MYKERITVYVELSGEYHPGHRLKKPDGAVQANDVCNCSFCFHLYKVMQETAVGLKSSLM